jgi:nucleotide-binding universal stress UspA family protein
LALKKTMKGSVMFKKILIPIDGSELALRAAATGVNLAKEMNAEVVFLHAIIPYIPQYTAEYDIDGRAAALVEKAANEAAIDMLKAAEDVAKTANVKCSSTSEISSRPEKLIEATVKRLQCDLVVIATHGRGAFGRFIMGSTTTRLLPIASVPVLVYRDQNMIDDFFE